MLILSYAVGGVETNLNKWVDWSTVKISDQLNVPTTLSFTLTNSGVDFPTTLPAHAYVTLYSTHWKRSLFTGFINSQPAMAPLGIGPSAGNPRKIVFTYQVSCTSDEFLLNIKSVQFIPAFINQSQGAILSSIANALCPGFFNTDNVMSGDIVPYFAYDPSQSWSEIAKTFADGIRYRYKVRDKIIYYLPYGDGNLGIEYDEDSPEATFNPYGMKTNVFQVPMVNDVTIIGAVEAGNNREDYFIGDGFTGNFPLRHKVFMGGSTLLLSTDWTQDSLDTQQWYLEDPGGQFNFGGGALNLVSSFGFPIGFSFLQMNNGLELAGGLDVEHGEFGWNDASHGIVGGVYLDESMSPSACLAAFVITSPSGVTLTASGAAGVVMQPTYLGNAVGDPIVSQPNHTYVLQTLYNAATYTRYLQQYRSLAGGNWGGSFIDLPGDITFIVRDTDIAAATGFYYVPPVTKVVVNNAPLPAFAVYGLINNITLNCTINFTTVAKMPLGTLQAWEGPSGLWLPTGIILPLLPPGSGGYIGPVLPWPADGSAAIYPPPLTRTDFYTNEVMGNGFEQQAAQITPGNSSDTLAFYAESLPAAGTPIKLQTWEAQAATSRLQASGSIVMEAEIVGDDGLRKATVSNLNPLPRTSEDCDNAALAYLEDRTITWYNGTYTCTSFFLNQYTQDFTFWPVPGRFIFVNSPLRGIPRQKMLVTQVTMSVLDAVGTAKAALTKGDTSSVGEVLEFQLGFGPDLHLEKALVNFTDLTPANILTPKDSANPPDPRLTIEVDTTYLPDVKYIQAYPIKDAVVGIRMLDTSSSFPMEVRLTDSNWGEGATPNYLGTFEASGFIGTPAVADDEVEAKGLTFFPVPGGGGLQPVRPLPGGGAGTNWTLPGPTRGPRLTIVNFTLARQQYDQTWYMRYVSGGAMSRRAKVLRIVYPQKPAPPTIDYGDSQYVQFDFAGDIRSIFGFELRGLDNTTIIVQKPVESIADLLLDLTRTKATAPFTPIVNKASYFNASGQMNLFSSSPWGGDADILWTDFRVTSTIPSDATILGIYPVAQINAFVLDGATVRALTYDTSSSTPITQSTIQYPSMVYNGGAGDFGDFSASFADPQVFVPLDTDGNPISIGNQLGDISGRTIAAGMQASLYQGGPGLTPLTPQLTDEMDIGAVGFAIFYTSNTLPYIDPQMPQPFTPAINPHPSAFSPPEDSPPNPLLISGPAIPNMGLAWALPFKVTAYALPQGGGQSIFAAGQSTAAASPVVFSDLGVLDRDFYAYFFNHQWSYSTPRLYHVPVPDPPLLAIGSRFGQSIDVFSDTLTRHDIIYQRWQAANTEDFSNPFLDVQNNYQDGSFNFNCPATADVFVRSVRSDFISSGDWSDTLAIPIGDILSSDFFTAQGGAPIITSSSGNLISYTSTFDLIVVDVAAFTVLYPNSSVYQVPEATLSSSTTKDTAAPLQPGTGYLYYFSIASPAIDPNTTVDIDGPYANPSTTALAFTTADGRSPLTQGSLTFFTATATTGSGGGGGGGTGGGGTCGVPNSILKMADGSRKRLAEVKVGDEVDDGFGISERVVEVTMVPDVDVYTVVLASGKITRCALAHTLACEQGWTPLCDIMIDYIATGEYPAVATEDGDEPIVGVVDKGKDVVIYLKLFGPRHTYVLDGIKTHNALFKDGGA